MAAHEGSKELVLSTPVSQLLHPKSVLEKYLWINWKDWWWSWNSNSLAIWCEEQTHWERPWCWERLRAAGEGDDRGWDGWVASLTQWTWIWANSGRQWRMGEPGVLQSMQLQSQKWLSNWMTIIHTVCINFKFSSQENTWMSYIWWMCGHRHWLTNSNKLVIPFKLICWARKVIQVPRQELTHIVPPLKNRRTFLCFLFNTHWRAIHLSSAAGFLHEYLLTSGRSEQCPRAKQKGLRTSQVDALIWICLNALLDAFTKHALAVLPRTLGTFSGAGRERLHGAVCHTWG